MKWLKNIFVVILALGVFAGTLFWENNLSTFAESVEKRNVAFVISKEKEVQLERDGKTISLNQVSEIEFLPRDIVHNLQNDPLEIMVGSSVFRVGPNASLEYFSKNDDQELIFKLLKGRMWANTAISQNSIRIIAGGAYLIPAYSTFDVEYNESKVTVYAHTQHVKIGLIPVNDALSSFQNTEALKFINSFLLTQNNQVILFDSKIEQNTDVLKKLLYSKLIKEFQYGFIPAEKLKNDSWIQQNIELDKQFINNIVAGKFKKIRDRGMKTTLEGSFFHDVSDSISNMRNSLTFSQEKVLLRALNESFYHFEDAQYLILFGRIAESEGHLAHFREMVQGDLQNYGSNFEQLLLERLSEEYSDLLFISPSESLYSSKKVIIEVLFKYLGTGESDVQQKYSLTRSYLKNAYDFADTNSQLARVNLQEYFESLKKILEKEQKYSFLRENLAEDNKIIDNLFLQYPVFYRDDFFAMKNYMEQEWLRLMPEGSEKNEEKQNIIATKIDFLRKLKEFFLQDKIDLESARKIVFRLFREADDLQLPSETRVAVNDLFAMRLQDFGIFFRYLNSPEYSATTLHGASHQARFEKFLQARQEQININELREEILGENVEIQNKPLTEDILEEIRKDFENVGIVNIRFGIFDPAKDKNVLIEEAKYNTTLFKAKYDFERKLFFEIAIGEAAPSNESVPLDKLALFIQSRVNSTLPKPKPKPKIPVTSGNTVESTIDKTEKVAKILLLQKLKSNDITASESQIKIIDLVNSHFRIENASLISLKTVTFSFDLVGKDQWIQNFKIRSATGEEENIEIPLVLEELSSYVSVYEKQLQETDKVDAENF